MAIAIARRLRDVDRAFAARLVDEILKQIAEAIHVDDSLQLSGFGTFLVTRKRARMGRNPNTSEPTVITGRRVLTFRASLKLKAVMNCDPNRGEI